MTLTDMDCGISNTALLSKLASPWPHLLIARMAAAVRFKRFPSPDPPPLAAGSAGAAASRPRTSS